MKGQQRGMSLIGLILVSALLIGAAIVVMKVVPSVLEYFTVLKNVKTIANSGVTSPLEVRKAYDRQMSIDDTPSVASADLEINKQGDGVVISFEYEKKIPIFGNVSICIDYAGSSSGAGRPY